MSLIEETRKFAHKVQKQMVERAAEKEKQLPFLHKYALEISKIDSKIDYFESKKKDLEKEKQELLKKFFEFMEAAHIQKFSLPNNYTIKVDDTRETTIHDVGLFMKWLKENFQPHEVFDFFETALKKTSVKKFVNKAFNDKRIDGEIIPSIPGMEFGEITYRRLTTGFKKGKK